MLKADCKGKQQTIILTTFSDRPSKKMVSKKKSGALKNILLEKDKKLSYTINERCFAMCISKPILAMSHVLNKA